MSGGTRAGRREGRTHWRRTPLLAAPATAAAGALLWQLGTGALAVDFRAQEKPLQLTTSSLYGTAYAAATVDQPVTRADGSAGSVPVLRMGFREGRVNGLCLSRQQEVLGVPYSIVLELGDDDPATWEVRTGETVIDLVSADGVLDLDGVVDINVNGSAAGTDGKGPSGGLGSGPDRFGLRADYAKPLHRRPDAGHPDPGLPHHAGAGDPGRAGHGALPGAEAAARDAGGVTGLLRRRAAGPVRPRRRPAPVRPPDRGPASDAVPGAGAGRASAPRTSRARAGRRAGRAAAERRRGPR